LRLRIFISSVQKEFAVERQALKTYVLGDALLSRFFDVFLFEDLPASDRRADDIYLQEVAQCDIYLALFGNEYGGEDADGLSPTHREFLAATDSGKHRLVFVKGIADDARHPKMRALLGKAGHELVRRRFISCEELIAAVYSSLIKVLETRELIRFAPFDASYCRNATLDDLDMEGVSRFLVLARRGRSFSLSEDTPPEEVLAHLNLLDKGRPSHAAILLFGKKPQRFLPTSTSIP
jgi:hypothetical protein